jgi:hypothetical protein
MGESQFLKPQIPGYRNALFGAVVQVGNADTQPCVRRHAFGLVGGNRGPSSRSHNALIWFNLDTVGSQCTQDAIGDLHAGR